MTRARTLVPCMLAAVCLALPCAAAQGSPVAHSAAASQMVQRINTFRAHHHLRALHANGFLTRQSRSHARWMIRHGSFSHSAMGSMHGFRSLGECLALTVGHRQVGTTLRNWRNSAVHRAVLLRGAFNKVGIAAVKGRFQGRRVTIWVARFGTK
jgi:uncharacterized protein YkwD